MFPLITQAIQSILGSTFIPPALAPVCPNKLSYFPLHQYSYVISPGMFPCRSNNNSLFVSHQHMALWFFPKSLAIRTKVIGRINMEIEY